MPEIGTSGSMSGDGKRGVGRMAPSYRAHPRLYRHVIRGTAKIRDAIGVTADIGRPRGSKGSVENDPQPTLRSSKFPYRNLIPSPYFSGRKFML